MDEEGEMRRLKIQKTRFGGADNCGFTESASRRVSRDERSRFFGTSFVHF